MKDVARRAPMRSPGHPGHRRELERRFWDKVAEGMLPVEHDPAGVVEHTDEATLSLGVDCIELCAPDAGRVLRNRQIEGY